MPKPNNLIKTDVKNVYKFYENGKYYYAYRLLNKSNPKIDTFIQYDNERNRISSIKLLYQLADEKIALAKEKEKNKSTEIKGVLNPNDNRSFRTLCEYTLSHMQKAESTIIRYERIYKNHFKRYNYNGTKLVDIPTCDMSVGIWEDFLKDVQTLSYAQQNERSEKYKREYIVSFYKLIILVYGYAQKHNLISSDIYIKLNLLKFPKINDNNIKSSTDNEKEAIRILTKEQIKNILEYIKINYPNMYLPCLISLNSGARTAEAFAARFSDFDFENCTYSIHAQVVSRKGGKFLYIEPKTTSRTVSVSKELCEEVKKRKEFMDEQILTDNKIKSKITADERKKGLRSPMEQNQKPFYQDDDDVKGFIIDDLISTDEKGKFLFYTGSFKRPAKEIRKKFVPHEDGIEDFSFYTFRKTHLSIMADSGVPPQALAKRAGHKKMETLFKNYYSNSEKSEEKMKEVAEEIGKNFII